MSAAAVQTWCNRSAVKKREAQSPAGFESWQGRQRTPGKHDFVGIRYILLHTLAHLVVESMSMTCGYSSSSTKERIYCDAPGGALRTALVHGDGRRGWDGGRLGGGGAEHLQHLESALRGATLCSNDPIRTEHESGESMEGRWLRGFAPVPMPLDRHRAQSLFGADQRCPACMYGRRPMSSRNFSDRRRSPYGHRPMPTSMGGRHSKPWPAGWRQSRSYGSHS